MIRPRPASKSLGQHIWELLASLNTRNSFIPEWRALSPAHQQAFEAAVAQRLKDILAEEEEDEETP